MEYISKLSRKAKVCGGLGIAALLIFAVLFGKLFGYNSATQLLVKQSPLET